MPTIERIRRGREPLRRLQVLRGARARLGRVEVRGVEPVREVDQLGRTYSRLAGEVAEVLGLAYERVVYHASTLAVVGARSNAAHAYELLTRCACGAERWQLLYQVERDWRHCDVPDQPAPDAVAYAHMESLADLWSLRGAVE